MSSRSSMLLLAGALSVIAQGSMETPRAADAFGAPAARTAVVGTLKTDAGRSSGCGMLAKSTGLLNLTTTDGKRRSRTFRVLVPPHYDAGRAYPLVLVFHGADGSSAQSYSWGLQNVAGAGDSALFAFPDGIKFQSYGVGWDDTSTGYDVPFFDRMVSDVEAQFCVDAARVFAVGFSWGGDFVTTLICDRGEVLRAAAVNSATDEFKDHGNYSTYQNLPCPAAKRPAIRFAHADGGDPQYPAPLFATTSTLLQHLSSCGTATSVSHVGALSCASYTACANDYADCSFDARIGHALPPNWAADTWAFFSTLK